MADQSVRHESLLLPGYWRVTSFGKLTENPLSARSKQDLRIRIDVARLYHSENILPEWGRTDADSLRTMLLPVGEIPRVYLNTIIHNGEFINGSISRLDSEVKRTRALNCARSHIRVITRTHCDDDGNQVIPVRDKWSGLLDDPDRYGLFIAFESKEDPYATIIPAVEVYRFFYATSDVLAKALLRDHFLDPTTYLWNPEKTAMDSDGRAVLWLRQHMLDADARFLARFAFSEYALLQAQQIFLYASAISDASGERTIRAIPPFEDTCDFEFLCFPIGGPANQRVLVTRLCSCNWKPPFTELKWDRDNDGRFDSNNRDDRPATGRNGPSLLAIPPEEETQTAALSNTPASVPAIPFRLKEEEIRDRFPYLGNIPAEKLPQENAATRAQKRSWKALLLEAYKGSVVDGQSSSELVGRAIIEGLEKQPEQTKERADDVDVTAGSADYVCVLQLLLLIQKHSLAKVQFVEALQSITCAHGVTFNVYPAEMDGKKKAWLYIDQSKKYRRMVLLSEVFFEERVRYVIELQQRHTTGGSSTLVVWRPQERPMQPGLLAHLILDCARAETTTLNSAKNLGIKWSRLHHTQNTISLEDAAHFLQRIFSTQSLI